MYGARAGTCKNCGHSFDRRNYQVEFCGAPCRMQFNNRRTKRGGELYDLAMLNRFGDVDKEKGKLTRQIAALLDRWREDDEGQRGGRVSWGDLPYARRRQLGLR